MREKKNTKIEEKNANQSCTRENEMKTMKKKSQSQNKTNFVVLMFLVHINFHKNKLCW